MAKTESTAVNELIDLVQNKRQVSEDPASDLFAAPKSTKVHPRVTTAGPTLRGAGEVAPLPRGRAPQSTSNHQLPTIPTPVRMSTAEASRGNTIPSLAPAPRDSEPSSPTLPRPTPTSPTLRPSPPQRPTLRGTQPPPTFTAPPASTPVAAPFETRRPSDNPLVAMPLGMPQQYPIVRRSQASIDMTGDVVRTDTWFENTVQHNKHEETWVGTAPVVRQRRPPDTVALVKKLIAPTIVLAIVGVMVGGYFAFDGEGGKKTTAKAKAAPAVAAKLTHEPEEAAAPTPSSESANAATASAGGEQPQPPTKEEATPPPGAATDDNSMLPAATKAALTHDAPAPEVAAAKPEATKPEAAKPEAKISASVEAAKPLVRGSAASPAAAKPEAKISASVEAAKPAAKVEAKVETAKPTPMIAKSAAPAPGPAPAAVPAPQPAAPPVAAIKTSSKPSAVREVKTPQGVLKFVDVRIDSKPSGATVMLVDNGKTSFLGSTPIATSLDPSRSYDVIFTAAGRPAQMAHLDPATTSRLDVKLGRSVAAAVDTAATKTDSTQAKAETHHHHHHHTKAAPPTNASNDGSASAAPEAKPEKKLDKLEKQADKAEPKKVEKVEKVEASSDDEDPLSKKATKAAPKADKAEPKADKAAEPKKETGSGTLMVASKPPCEIWVDGKSTGLTTPQRAIPLSAGTHKVTFVNATENIKKTVSVSINADQSTKLIQDLMAK